MHTALITVHAGDIYADDHTIPLATLHDGPIEVDAAPLSLGGDPDGAASVEMYAPPSGRPPVVTFVGRWTDRDGVRHGVQLPVDFDRNVYDFGPYRAVVTVG